MSLSIRRRLIVVFVFALCIVIAASFKFDSRSEAKMPVGPVIAATQTVTFAPGGDVDSDGKADPGDTLLYTTTITNTGTDATGVVLTDDMTAKPLTLVNTTLNIS